MKKSLLILFSMRDQIFLWIKVMNLALGEIMFNLGLGHDLNIFPHYKLNFIYNLKIFIN